VGGVLNLYVDRLSNEPARLRALSSRQACRSRIWVVAVESIMDDVREARLDDGTGGADVRMPADGTTGNSGFSIPGQHGCRDVGRFFYKKVS